MEEIDEISPGVYEKIELLNNDMVRNLLNGYCTPDLYFEGSFQKAYAYVSSIGETKTTDLSRSKLIEAHDCVVLLDNENTDFLKLLLFCRGVVLAVENETTNNTYAIRLAKGIKYLTESVGKAFALAGLDINDMNVSRKRQIFE
jgi:hypothetical protein